jgi:hypothetical protein
MNTPTQEEISQRAYQLWQDSDGAGEADANWFEAERQLSDESLDAPSGPLPSGSSHHQKPSEAYRPNAVEQRETQQKLEARAPQLPLLNVPRPVPAATGKPLWSQPHSS